MGYCDDCSYTWCLLLYMMIAPIRGVCFYTWFSSGKFAITISTTENGRSLSPKLVVSGMDTSESKRVTLLSSTGDVC